MMLIVSSFLAMSVRRFLYDSLVLPGYVAVTSAVILVLHLTFSSRIFRRLVSRVFQSSRSLERDSSPEFILDVPADNLSGEFSAHVTHHGGTVIFAYKVARLAGCLALLGFSIYSFAVDMDFVTPQGLGSGGKWGKKHKHRKHQGYDLSVEEWLEGSMSMTYVCPTRFYGVLWIHTLMLAVRVFAGSRIRFRCV
jgi:hypothetical protein